MRKPTPPDGPDPSPTERGIKQVHALLKAAGSTDTDDTCDAIGTAHPRVLAAVRTFLKTLADNDAVCSLAYDGDLLRFRDAEQARRSLGVLERLGTAWNMLCCSQRMVTGIAIHPTLGTPRSNHAHL